jgi:hypothetical protein
MPEEHDLSYLHTIATSPAHPLAPAERAALHRAAEVFRSASRFVLWTGGKAGRIGESVVETALVYATLLALRRMRRRPPPVTLVVDEGVRELFAPALFRERFWPDIEIVSGMPSQSDALARDASLQGLEQEVLLLDLNGAHTAPPFLRTERRRRGPYAPWRTLHTFGQLFGTAVMRFAGRGQERRYADAVETLFSLPAYTLDGYEAQPSILLSDKEHAQAVPMLRRLGVAPGTIPFLCFFQSVAVAKCYDSWWEVMEGIAQAVAVMAPQRRVDFLLVCGPNESGHPGLDRASLEALFAGFGAAGGNARVLVCDVPSLRDLAILATRCVTLANDTGPGHVAGAAGSPVVTPYLPGEVYPKRIWASTPRHRGITAEPSPFTNEAVQNAVLWGENRLMTAIPPQDLVATAVDVVQLRYGPLGRAGDLLTRQVTSPR